MLFLKNIFAWAIYCPHAKYSLKGLFGEFFLQFLFSHQTTVLQKLWKIFTVEGFWSLYFKKRRYKKVIEVFIFKMTCKVLTATIFFYLYLTTLNDWWKCVSYNIQWRNSIFLIDNTAVKFPIKSTLEMLNLS